MSTIDGLDKPCNSITDEMCDNVKAKFGDTNDHKAKGGLKKMGEALKKGMVLVMSLWDDHDANMLWLDSTYPTDKTSWGGPRGTCPTDGGKPADVERMYPNSHVKYSDIRFGDFDSTYQDMVSPMENDTQIIQ